MCHKTRHDKIFNSQPDALEQRDLGLAAPTGSTRRNIGEVAPNAFPRPPLPCRLNQVTSFGSCRSTIVDKHRTVLHDARIHLSHERPFSSNVAENAASSASTAG